MLRDQKESPGFSRGEERQESYELRCARHHQHDPNEAHTDGEGAFWGDDGEVKYR